MQISIADSLQIKSNPANNSLFFSSFHQSCYRNRNQLVQCTEQWAKPIITTTAASIGTIVVFAQDGRQQNQRVNRTQLCLSVSISFLITS